MKDKQSKDKQSSKVMIVKMQIPAGKANPAPPVASMLGPKGVNLPKFCSQFNAMTENQTQGDPIPVKILVSPDKTFQIFTRNPPVSFLIKKLSKIAKGSKTPGREIVGKVAKDILLEVAKIKVEEMGLDNNPEGLRAALASVRGTALSMGLKVEGFDEND